MATARMNMNFQCEICEKTFSTKKYQKEHIGIVHGEVKAFECNVCSKTFPYKNEL